MSWTTVQAALRLLEFKIFFSRLGGRLLFPQTPHTDT